MTHNAENEARMTKGEFEHHMRALVQMDRGDETDELCEADFVCDLAEDGWPDHDKWLRIYCRIVHGGELTSQERRSAIVYWTTDDIDAVPAEYRLP